ncbi:hypothetical protein MTBLM5_510004 [Magnetospirillum sp. LM-5]|nr:hypothetical protein MTBLM5_510004 [Magnetospirillum sp. LM-5]
MLALCRRPDEPEILAGPGGQGRPQRSVPVRVGQEVQEVLRWLTGISPAPPAANAAPAGWR